MVLMIKKQAYWIVGLFEEEKKQNTIGKTNTKSFKANVSSQSYPLGIHIS